MCVCGFSASLGKSFATHRELGLLFLLVFFLRRSEIPKASVENVVEVAKKKSVRRGLRKGRRAVLDSDDEEDHRNAEDSSSHPAR